MTQLIPLNMSPGTGNSSYSLWNWNTHFMVNDNYSTVCVYAFSAGVHRSAYCWCAQCVLLVYAVRTVCVRSVYCWCAHYALFVCAVCTAGVCSAYCSCAQCVLWVCAALTRSFPVAVINRVQQDAVAAAIAVVDVVPAALRKYGLNTWLLHPALRTTQHTHTHVHDMQVHVQMQSLYSNYVRVTAW